MVDASGRNPKRTVGTNYTNSTRSVAVGRIAGEPLHGAVDLIIFGASGDLSARKLFCSTPVGATRPLDADLRIAAVARRESLDDFLPLLKQKMSSTWGAMRPPIKNGNVSRPGSLRNGQFFEPDQYGELREWLDDDALAYSILRRHLHCSHPSAST